MTESNLYRHRGYTLVDITKTDITKYTPELERMRNKQRNWETVSQVLGLRTQILGLRQLKTEKQDVKDLRFGTAYQGQHRVWSFEFEVEFDNLYLNDGNNYATLENDFAQSPVVTGLDETAKFTMPLFYTAGENKNIYFISVATN